jgi:tripartite-type tricarboxylate transporter receptor subunit TctC
MQVGIMQMAMDPHGDHRHARRITMNRTIALRKLLPVLGCFCLPVAPSAAQQAYPSQPVQIVVPFAPGGSIDITYRTIAPSLSKRLGQQVVVVNRPGGGATIGMNGVAKAAPDGHTLGAASFAFAANPGVLGDKMPYDSLKDFAPVTMVARSHMLMLVNPKTPVNTVQEFINYAKARPGELNFGSVGIASSGHLISELFASRAGLKMIHVPFTKGPLGPLAQGQIQLQFGPIPSAIGWVKDGRLRAIGVTSTEPDPTVPGVPPVAATVPGFEAYEWPGLVAPAGTPREIIDQIQREVALTVAEPEVKARFATLGSLSVGNSPEEFAAFIRKEMALWDKVARSVAASAR